MCPSTFLDPVSARPRSIDRFIHVQRDRPWIIQDEIEASPAAVSCWVPLSSEQMLELAGLLPGPEACLWVSRGRCQTEDLKGELAAICS